MNPGPAFLISVTCLVLAVNGARLCGGGGSLPKFLTARQVCFYRLWMLEPRRKVGCGSSALNLCMTAQPPLKVWPAEGSGGKGWVCDTRFNKDPWTARGAAHQTARAPARVLTVGFPDAGSAGPSSLLLLMGIFCSTCNSSKIKKYIFEKQK